MTVLTLVSPPAIEPVMLSEMKAHARIDTNADDALLAGLITAARQWAERYTNRAFISQSYRLYRDHWGADAQDPWWDGVREGPIMPAPNLASVTLPRPPLLSVTSVQTFDNADIATVWSSSNYYVDSAREPGRLALRMGASWPIPMRPANGIAIDYIAGYGASADAVPEAIKTAIRQLAAYWYDNRGEASGSVAVPMVVEALLAPFRIQTMGA